MLILAKSPNVPRWTAIAAALLTTTSLDAQTSRDVLVIAHRAAGHDVPENSLAAIRAAVAANAPAVTINLFILCSLVSNKVFIVIATRI